MMPAAPATPAASPKRPKTIFANSKIGEYVRWLASFRIADKKLSPAWIIPPVNTTISGLKQLNTFPIAIPM